MFGLLRSKVGGGVEQEEEEAPQSWRGLRRRGLGRGAGGWGWVRSCWITLCKVGTWMEIRVKIKGLYYEIKFKKFYPLDF